MATDDVCKCRAIKKPRVGDMEAHAISDIEKDIFFAKMNDMLAKWWSTALDNASSYYVNKDPKLRRGLVHCLACGEVRKVNSAKCLRLGWPKCCGKTMSLDSPEERNER
jgi:hypothetical protein